jgi:hypothetical protein
VTRYRAADESHGAQTPVADRRTCNAVLPNGWFNGFAPGYVSTQWRSWSLGKAGECPGAPWKFLKLCFPKVIDNVNGIFNTDRNAGKFPEKFEKISAKTVFSQSPRKYRKIEEYSNNTFPKKSEVS